MLVVVPLPIWFCAADVSTEFPMAAVKIVWVSGCKSEHWNDYEGLRKNHNGTGMNLEVQ